MGITIKHFPENSPMRTMAAIGAQYAAAIERRGRTATDTDFLISIWRNYGSAFVRLGKNFLILAQVGGGIHVATHFAPATLPGGYRLIKAVVAAKLPIVFAVTEDLAVNLERLGYVRAPKWVATQATQKGMPSGKVILLPKGLLGLLWALIKTPRWGFDNTTSERACAFRRRAPRQPRFTAKKTTPIGYIGDVWP